MQLLPVLTTTDPADGSNIRSAVNSDIPPNKQLGFCQKYEAKF
jgi:hypothetical protein